MLTGACDKKYHRFDGIEGPPEDSTLFEPDLAFPEEFDVGETGRLAIWLTNSNSNWLGLTRGLKSIGIPFRITNQYQLAIQHEVVLVYPHISGKDLPPSSFRTLRRYVKNGGTLIGINVLGGGMQDVFGYEKIFEGKNQAYLILSPKFDETQEFEKKGLTLIKIGSETKQETNIGTNSYKVSTAEAIARYKNGEAAILFNRYGKGRAYAWGIDPGQLFAKGYNRRQEDITAGFANLFQPTIDSLLILLENIYIQNQPGGITLGTVPDGKKLSFIMSHDIDYSKSLKNAVIYAENQKNRGVEATYFIQTKYIEDYNDSIFFNEKGVALVQHIEKLGGEIASHSVAHARDLWDFPVGNGKERYPDYRPFVQTSSRSKNGTILGELRVSKFLLEKFTRVGKVSSFRPGYLANPVHMPQGLATAGYLYSSSSTANISLTHLPFQLTHGRGFKKFSPIYEFPITIEDELPPDIYTRIGDTIEVARKISEIGGLFVVLIHTDAVDQRMVFHNRILEEVTPYAWIGTLKTFGEWWSARDRVSVDTRIDDEKVIISLNAPVPISGLTLEMNKCYNIVDAGDIEIQCESGNYLLGPIVERNEIILEK